MNASARKRTFLLIRQHPLDQRRKRSCCLFVFIFVSPSLFVDVGNLLAKSPVKSFFAVALRTVDMSFAVLIFPDLFRLAEAFVPGPSLTFFFAWNKLDFISRVINHCSFKAVLSAIYLSIYFV